MCEMLVCILFVDTFCVHTSYPVSGPFYAEIGLTETLKHCITKTCPWNIFYMEIFSAVKNGKFHQKILAEAVLTSILIYVLD